MNRSAAGPLCRTCLAQPLQQLDLVPQPLYRRLLRPSDPGLLRELVHGTATEDPPDKAGCLEADLALLVGLPENRQPSQRAGKPGAVLSGRAREP